MVAWQLHSEDKASGYCKPVTCVMCYILQPDWLIGPCCLLLVNIQSSLYCKQGSL